MSAGIRYPSLAALIERLALCQALIVADDIGRIEQVLKSALDTYTELAFRSDGRRIDLITVSNDPAVGQSYFNLLEQRGASEKAIAGCQRFLQLGRGKTIIFKLPVAGPLEGGEVYIRGALPLAELFSTLEQDSVYSPALSLIQEIGQLTKKDHSRMLGRDVAERPFYTTFFTTYLAEEQEELDSQLLQKYLIKIGVNDIGQELLMAAHALFSLNRPQTLFISLQTAAGQPAVRAKLDYEGVRLRWIDEVMRWAGLNEAAEILTEWSQVLGLKKASYVGLPICEKGIDGFRVYFRLSGL